MSKSIVAVMALVVAGAALVAAAWFDSSVMREVQRTAAAAFDQGSLGLAWAIGSIVIAGSVLGLGGLAWRSGSLAVGTVYAVVGAFFAFLPVLLFDLGAQVNDTPPVLPQPIADAVGQVYLRVEGPLNAVVIIGAGMLVAGLAVIVRSLRSAPTAETAAVLPPAPEEVVRP